MPKYQVLETGEETTADDPRRGIWYSSGCTYFTDDWTKVASKTRRGIPCCPNCSAPGYQVDALKWDAGAAEFEKTHPRYREFLAKKKETCSFASLLSFYHDFIKEN